MYTWNIMWSAISNSEIALYKYTLLLLFQTDPEIEEGMKLSFSALKQVIEGAAGAGVGALLKHKFPQDVNNIGVILCGGNVDIDKLPWYQHWISIFECLG